MTGSVAANRLQSHDAGRVLLVCPHGDGGCGYRTPLDEAPAAPRVTIKSLDVSSM